MSSSRMLTMVAGAAAVVALAGCSGSATTTAVVTPVATSSTMPPPPPPSPTGTVGGIDATITAADPAPLRPGGEPKAFTVTLTNTTPADIPDVGLVVSFGHCACGRPGASIMPAGAMRMLDPDGNAWVPVRYVVEGTGTDYLNATLVPPFVLEAGQTATYRLEASLNADPEVTAGSSLLTVTLTTPTGRGHAGAVSVAVEPQAA